MSRHPCGSWWRRKHDWHTVSVWHYMINSAAGWGVSSADVGPRTEAAQRCRRCGTWRDCTYRGVRTVEELNGAAS